MFNIGTQELILILIVALVVFGPKKLPELGRALGKGLREFKKAAGEIQKTFEDEVKEVKEVQKEIRNVIDK